MWHVHSSERGTLPRSSLLVDWYIFRWLRTHLCLEPCSTHVIQPIKRWSYIKEWCFVLQHPASTLQATFHFHFTILQSTQHEMTSLTLLAMLALAFAKPIAFTRDAISAADLEFIAPETGTCDNAPFPDECVTASMAAPYISVGFSNFGIESFNAQASLVAIMLFESAVSNHSLVGEDCTIDNL